MGIFSNPIFEIIVEIPQTYPVLLPNEYCFSIILMSKAKTQSYK
jgi:hypothetical protein